jgi:hypothetical protein
MHYDFASEQRSPQLQQAVYLFTNAQSQFINRKISPAEFDKKIYEQSKNMAREEVKAKNEEIIVKQKISSVGYLASIKKALMAWSGYEVTDEQK